MTSSISNGNYGSGLVLLAPPTMELPGSFRKYEASRLGRSQLVEIQRLRGRIYLDDGAIQLCQLTSPQNGLHVQPEDKKSWHLATCDPSGKIAGCLRFLVHQSGVTFPSLSSSQAALAKCQTQGQKFQLAVESELLMAKKENKKYVEIGAWAISEHARGTSHVLRLVLGAYALGRILGGAIGLCTATTRHGSSRILRKIGGKSLRSGHEEIQPYYDPAYGCNMEILGFDSGVIDSKFEPMLSEIINLIQNAPVGLTN